MDAVVALVAEHRLLAIFLGVFAGHLGAPIPALPFVLLAGGKAASDGVFAAEVVAVSTVATMLANTAWYFTGRRIGRRVLALLCRISISPDTCVQRSELSFARRGEATLVIAKFVPGLGIVAPPLAGALGMTLRSFAIFNLAGAVLWAVAWLAVGIVFHDQIDRLLAMLAGLGNAAIVLAAVALGAYVAWRAWRRWRIRAETRRQSAIDVDRLAAMQAAGIALVVVDVRTADLSWGGRIPGAVRIDLASLDAAPLDDWPADADIVTYCDCPNDASAVEAARRLARRGRSARVLRGGFDAWTRAGHPVVDG